MKFRSLYPDVRTRTLSNSNEDQFHDTRRIRHKRVVSVTLWWHQSTGNAKNVIGDEDIIPITNSAVRSCSEPVVTELVLVAVA